MFNKSGAAYEGALTLQRINRTDALANNVVIPGITAGTGSNEGLFAIRANGQVDYYAPAAALPAPEISSNTTASARVGSSFSYQITANNSPSSFGATGLPAGLSINTTTGLITGTPTATGTSNVTISATNSGGTGTAVLVLTVSAALPPAPVISSATSASGRVGTSFSYQIAASNSPTSYAVTGLPSGLSINTSTGAISGAPTAAGTFSVTITATNAGGADSATLTLTILPRAPVISSATSASGRVGTSFSYQIAASNSPTSYAATGLPGGLSINTSTGAISGTPTVAGSSSVTISATNAGGTGQTTLTLTIVEPTITVTGALTNFTATQGTASNAQTFNVSGANLTGNVTVTAPPNFEVSADGTNFFTSRTLTQSSGSVASTTISVRIAATAPNGPVSGNVLINSSGASESALPASGVVGSLPAVVAVSNFSPFSATQGTASAAQTFTVSGANLTDNVTIAAPANFEVSIDGTNFFASRTIAPSSGSLAVTLIFVRVSAVAPVGGVSGSITVSSAGATSQIVAVSGSVVPPPSVTTTGTLAAFTTTAGTASTAQTFTVSGANLTGDVTVAAPSGFEVSNGSSYTGRLVLTQSAGTLASTTISVRLSAAATIGSPSGNIAVSSSGASSKTVGVSGTVVPPPSLSTSGTLTSFTTSEGTASSVQTFTVSGSNLAGNVTVAALSGFEVSSNGTSFSTALTLTPSSGAVSESISVRVAAAAPSGSLSGNISVSTTGVASKTVSVNATVTAMPRINVVGSLIPFSAISGTASAEQTLQLSGSNLTGNVTIAVPERFEVSPGGGQPFGSILTINPVSGSIVNQSIFIRLAAAPVGNYSGDLGFSTSGASAIKVAVSGTVDPPPTVTGSAKFVTFNATLGSASSSQSFSVSGANLTAPVTVAAPTGYEVSLDNSSFGATQAINPLNGAVASEVYLRIAATTGVGSPSGTIRISSTGSTERSLPVNGKVVPPPFLTLSGILSELNTRLGTASTGRTFSVFGSDLTGNVTVTAPAGFEVTGQRKPYARTIVMTPSQGRLDVPVTVRISRTAALGNLSGNITVTSAGAAAKQIAVQGKVSSVPSLSLSGSVKAFNTTRGRPSVSQSFLVSGSALNSVVSVTAPAGFQVSLNNANFSSRVQLKPANQTVSKQRIWIRLASGTKARTYSGNITASSTGASTKIIRINGRIR